MLLVFVCNCTLTTPQKLKTEFSYCAAQTEVYWMKGEKSLQESKNCPVATIGSSQEVQEGSVRLTGESEGCQSNTGFRLEGAISPNI